MFVNVRRVEPVSQPAAEEAAGLLSRLKDPQVWVCAIAAFTLVGLSSGLLGGSEPVPQGQTQLLASAGK